MTRVPSRPCSEVPRMRTGRRTGALGEPRERRSPTSPAARRAPARAVRAGAVPA